MRNRSRRSPQTELVLRCSSRRSAGPDVLHHEIGQAFFGAAGIEQARDVRMIERREDLRLDLEALQQGLRAVALPQHLDRDFLLILIVVANALVDLAHAAAADFLDDAIVADASADPGRRRAFRARARARDGRRGAR